MPHRYLACVPPPMRTYGLYSDAACRVAPQTPTATISVYHPHTNSVPSPYLGRFMFGFRLKAKPEHEAAQVGRWYGDGREEVLRIPCRHWGNCGIVATGVSLVILLRCGPLALRCWSPLQIYDVSNHAALVATWRAASRLEELRRE